MNIAVLFKHVPDLVEELEIDDSGVALDTTWMRYIINEFDDHAIEQAILIKEQVDAQVTVISPDAEGTDDVLFPTILRQFVKMAVKQRCENINFYMPPDHPFARYVQGLGCDLITHYQKDGGGMMRVINHQSLFEKIGDLLQERAQRLDLEGPASLRIKTDLGATSVPLKDVPARSARHRKMISLRMPQNRLAQLIAGHRNIRDMSNDPDVKAAKGTQRITDVLFAGTIPYMWLADRF